MTEESQVVEILHKASELGMREETIQYARHLRELNPKLNRVDAYEIAMKYILEATEDIDE